jgi:hypothetical protein
MDLYIVDINIVLDFTTYQATRLSNMTVRAQLLIL